MLRLGWKAGPEQFEPNMLLECAIAAEESGFDLLEASDHFHPWSEDGQACFIWTWLGAVAARTRRISLGTGVTAPILRYHPAVIAQAAATLGVMAPGRAFLSVGTGEALNDYAATGRWPGYSERQMRLREALGLIHELWDGKPVSYEGQYYQTKKARLYTRPDHPVPLYISTLVPESATFAGRYGDGLITTGGKPREVYQQIIQKFEEGARSVGKDPAAAPRIIELSVAFTDDVDGAVNDMKRYWGGAIVPALYDQKIYTPTMAAQNGQVVGGDVIRQQMVISTRPDEHVMFAMPYIELGFDTLIFHSPQTQQRQFIENYGREVLPLLRGRAQRETAMVSGAAGHKAHARAR